MRGQYIKLSGVNAATSLGLPKISMTPADILAIKIAQLSHVVSARSMSISGGLLSGRSRVTGAPLTLKGTDAATLTLKTLAGKTGIGSSASQSIAALALPAGSATPSYCAVMAIGTPSSVRGSANQHNYLYSYTSAGAPVAAAARYYGAASDSPSVANKVYMGGSDAVSPWASVEHPGGDWVVVVSDFNNTTRVGSLSLNGGAFATETEAQAHAPGADGYFSIGYAGSYSSLYGGAVGDLYLFNDSMLSTAERQAQIAGIVGALKTEYGIA